MPQTPGSFTAKGDINVDFSQIVNIDVWIDDAPATQRRSTQLKPFAHKPVVLACCDAELCRPRLVFLQNDRRHVIRRTEAVPRVVPAKLTGNLIQFFCACRLLGHSRFLSFGLGDCPPYAGRSGPRTSPLGLSGRICSTIMSTAQRLAPQAHSGVFPRILSPSLSSASLRGVGVPLHVPALRVAPASLIERRNAAAASLLWSSHSRVFDQRDHAHLRAAF